VTVFSATFREQAGARVIAVEGDFDLGGSTAFRVARDKATEEEGPLVIDLSECSFIDSTGIACVIRTFERAERARRAFALVASDFHVRRVLELVGVPERIPCFETMDEALRSVAPAEG
jgi:anti-anti-sigma factor